MSSYIFYYLKPSPEVHLSKTAYTPMATSRAEKGRLYPFKKYIQYEIFLLNFNIYIPPNSQNRKLNKNMVYLTHPEIYVKSLGRRVRRVLRL